MDAQLNYRADEKINFSPSALLIHVKNNITTIEYQVNFWCLLLNMVQTFDKFIRYSKSLILPLTQRNS